MKIASIRDEAARNLRTGTTKALPFAITLAAIVAAVLILDVRAIGDIGEQGRRFDHAGASTRILTTEGAVTSQSCDSLTRMAGVRGAGALTADDPVTPSTSINHPIPAFLASPGWVTLISGRAPTQAGVWLPERLAQTLAAHPGDTLATTRGPMTIAGTYPYPEDGRDARLAYAVVIPTAEPDAYDECWARIWPDSPDAETILRVAARVDPARNDTQNVGQLNNTHGAGYSTHTAFVSRPSRFLAAAALLASLGLGYVAIRRRRLELASALHAQQPRTAQLLTVALETAAWATVGALLAATAVVVAAAAWTRDDLAAVAWLEARWVIAAALLTLVGALTAAASIKESHLFTYFKDR